MPRYRAIKDGDKLRLRPDHQLEVPASQQSTVIPFGEELVVTDVTEHSIRVAASNSRARGYFIRRAEVTPTNFDFLA